MANPTNYTKQSFSKAGYNLEAATSSYILLLQSEDDLLLENGVDNLLLESGAGIRRINYTKQSFGPTNFIKEVAS